jgi:glycogen phosphorylase
VRVELYADAVLGDAAERYEIKCGRQLVGLSGGYVYTTSVFAARPATDYTARVIPHRNGVAVPLEGARILWQR